MIRFKQFLTEQNNFIIPTKNEIVDILRKHPLIKLRERVKNAYLIGSFSFGKQHVESDVDIMLEVVPKKGYTSDELEEKYRNPLRQYFMKHNIREKNDSIHPQWMGRRIDLYFTYDITTDGDRPKIKLQ